MRAFALLLGVAGSLFVSGVELGLA